MIAMKSRRCFWIASTSHSPSLSGGPAAAAGPFRFGFAFL